MKLRDLEEVSSILVTHQLRDAFFVAEHMAVRRGADIAFERASGDKADEAEFIMLRDGQVAFEGNAGELRVGREDRSLSRGVPVVRFVVVTVVVQPFRAEQVTALQS